MSSSLWLLIKTLFTDPDLIIRALTTVRSPPAVGPVLCEFLEVLVHNVLYVRKLYPDTIFVKRKKYATVVYQSVHPDVNEYIAQVLRGVDFYVEKSQLHRLDLCILDTDKNTVCEKFVFDVVALKTRFER